MDQTERIAHYLATAERTLDWALARQNERGAYEGGDGQIQSYYKSPRCLAVAGRVAAAQRLVGHLRSVHARPDGDFTRRPDDRSARSGQTYFNAWLAWGLHSLGAFDLARRTVELLVSLQNPATGGLPAWREDDPERQIVDWGPTALGAIALVTAGRTREAARAGEALTGMLAAQPQPDSGLYLRTDWSGRLLTEYPADETTTHLIQFGAEAQVYWYFGAGIAALATLHLASGEERWLTGARQIFELAGRCRPASFHALTSAKIGWGSSLMWSITREAVYRDAAVEIADDFVSKQTPDGIWLRTPRSSAAPEQPLPVSLDTSIERACWLYEIARNLS